MLTLILKGKWYDMIRSGEKLEEYREIKEYYTTRFQNAGLIDEQGKTTARVQEVLFRRGYAKNAPQMVCLCACIKMLGRPEWGAEPNKPYYVLLIEHFIDVSPDARFSWKNKMLKHKRLRRKANDRPQ